MIGRADDHGVNLLLLVEHLAVILMFFGVGIFLKDSCRVRPVDIAQGDDVLAVQLFDIFPSLAANPNASNIQPLTRCSGSVQAEDRAGDNAESGGSQGRRAKKLAARE